MAILLQFGTHLLNFHDVSKIVMCILYELCCVVLRIFKWGKASNPKHTWCHWCTENLNSLRLFIQCTDLALCTKIPFSLQSLKAVHILYIFCTSMHMHTYVVHFIVSHIILLLVLWKHGHNTTDNLNKSSVIIYHYQGKPSFHFSPIYEKKKEIIDGNVATPTDWLNQSTYLQ